TEEKFANVAPLAGSIEYRLPDGSTMVMALLHGYVKQGSDSYEYTLHHLGLFFEHALARAAANSPDAVPATDVTRELMTSYVEFVRLLGARTAELHLALAQRREDPAFAPEPYTDFYRHGLYHGLLARLGRTMERLRYQLNRLPDAVREDAQNVLSRQSAIRE